MLYGSKDNFVDLDLSLMRINEDCQELAKSATKYCQLENEALYAAKCRQLRVLQQLSGKHADSWYGNSSRRSHLRATFRVWIKDSRCPFTILVYMYGKPLVSPGKLVNYQGVKTNLIRFTRGYSEK